jgi:hypothetical protein
VVTWRRACGQVGASSREWRKRNGLERDRRGIGGGQSESILNSPVDATVQSAVGHMAQRYPH